MSKIDSNDARSGQPLPRVCVIGSEETLASPLLREAVESLREVCVVETCASDDAEDARRLARERASEPFQALAAAGGDGSLSQVVRGCLECEAPLARGVALLPMGTGNDFGAMCGLSPDDLAGALRLAALGEPSLIDVIRSPEAGCFVNMATIGFAAEATAEASPGLKDALGRFAYLLSGLGRVAELEARRVRLKGPNGFAWEGDAYGVAVGNGRQAGGGFSACPDALLDDGLLDVAALPELPLAEVAAIVRDALRPAGEERPAFEALVSARLPWVEIETPEPIQANLDGEPAKRTRFRFEIVHKPLRFMLPEGAPVSNGSAPA